MLSEQAIKEFQDIYFSEYGAMLAFDDAASKAESLLRLYKAILKPSTHKGVRNGAKDHTSSIAQ